jgi:hypothetical protein
MEKVHEYYFWLQFRRQNVEQIKEIPYNTQLDPILNEIFPVLEKSNSVKQVNFFTNTPEIIQERRPVEQDLKNLLWRLGAFITIILRGEITKSNPLIQFLLDLFHFLEDATYSQKDQAEITEKAIHYVNKWKDMQQHNASYYEADERSYNIIFGDLKYTMDGIQKYLI